MRLPVSPTVAGVFSPADPSGTPCQQAGPWQEGQIPRLLHGWKTTAGNPQVTHAQPGCGDVEGHRHRLTALQRFPFCREACGHSAGSGPGGSGPWFGRAGRAARSGRAGQASPCPGHYLFCSGSGERAVLWEAGEGRGRQGGLSWQVPVLGLPSVRPRDEGALQRSRPARPRFPGSRCGCHAG